MILFFFICPNQLVNLSDSFSYNLRVEQKSKNFFSFYSHKTRLSSLAYTVYDSQFTQSNLVNILNHKLSNYNNNVDIINNLWYQKLFISRFDKSNSQYYGQIYNLDFQEQKLRYKTLISNFSQLLKNQPICSFEKFNTQNNNSVINYDIEYHWSSTFNKMILPIRNILFRHSLNDSYHLTQSIPNDLLYTDLPLYLVSNHLGQIMAAEMPNISNRYNSINLSKNNIATRSQIWFFMNIQDAKEYLNSVVKEKSPSNKHEKLKIFNSNLETFYRLKNKYSNKAIFRIVPDLNDLGFLMTEYKNNKLLSFHPKQNTGRFYFQGQPIYFIELQNNNKQKKYHSKIWNKNGKESILVFLNYKDANLELSKWKKNHQSFSSIYRSRIIVYNLEKFLDTIAQNQELDSIKYTIIPPKTSYLYMKEESTKNLYWKKHLKILDNMSSINFWLKRIFWSLTSKNPIEA